MQVKTFRSGIVKHRKAFTLIELLIVVAIIGILALIVIPNFLTAQVKAKVARSQADIRSIVNSLMMYRSDNNDIPPLPESSGTSTVIAPVHVTVLKYLTTPIAYFPAESAKSPFSQYHGYWYYNWSWFVENSGEAPQWYYNNIAHPDRTLWMVDTLGPVITEKSYDVVGDNQILWYEYNPSNGIHSRGIIQIHGN